MELINTWFRDVTCNQKVQPYITQSTLNYTRKGEYHHNHTHPNSYLSGVLYIAGDDSDAVQMTLNEYTQIWVYPDDTMPNYQNQYNQGMIMCPANTGKIILFPSKLQHNVQVKESDTLRISIAFNVFIRGTFGGYNALTELRL
jgi:uncharacterized protein (TIGR02466 family)